MAKTWYDHFKFSMDSLGLPAPQSLFDACSRATVIMGALIAALKTVGTGAAKTMTIRQLLTASRAGAGLRVTLGASSASELLTIGGGIMLSFYLGAMIGAASYATGQKASDWVDDLFTHDEATDTAQQMQATVARYGIRPP